tara:strand:- start:18957 stop:19247 length:291 start_codon:yes stop_codon:yes gene_type:complete
VNSSGSIEPTVKEKDLEEKIKKVGVGKPKPTPKKNKTPRAVYIRRDTTITVKFTKEEMKKLLELMEKQKAKTPFRVTRQNFVKALIMKCVDDEITV